MNDEVDWTQNCLTAGIHTGRLGALWSIPLGYAVIIFRAEYLRDLVIERIYNDAMQYVEQSPFVQKGTEATYTFTKEWAEEVKAKAEELYPNTLQRKVGELSKYYQSPGWEIEEQDLARRVRENKLNSLYEPLHGHDTINLLCRIIGVSASRSIETPN